MARRFPFIGKQSVFPTGTITQTEQQVRGAGQGVGSMAEPLERRIEDATVPFAPGVPLFPSLLNPPRTDGRANPRRYEYQTAWNLQVTENRPVPFRVLRDVADNCDLARRCIELIKASFMGLTWDISLAPVAIERMMSADDSLTTAEAARKARFDLQPQISKAEDFWRMPDRINGLTFTEWVGCLLEEVLVIDALTIYPNMTLDNQKLHSLEILDGTTIKPLLDDRGGRPVPPHPAYQQILYGFPRGEFTASADDDGQFTADDLLYMPRTRRTQTPYGYSVIERSLPLLDLYMKRQQWLRAEFTDGVLPEMLIKTDATFGSSPELLRAYEQVFNDSLAGMTEQRKRARLLPAGMEPIAPNGWDNKFNPSFDELLVKDICGHFGVLPSQLGHVPGRGLGGSGHQEGERQSTESYALSPLVTWVTDLLNTISYRFLGISRDLTFVFTDGTNHSKEAAAKRRQVELFSGQKTWNDVRAEVGLPLFTFPEADMPIIVAGASVVPLAGVASPAVEYEATEDDALDSPEAPQETPDTTAPDNPTDPQQPASGTPAPRAGTAPTVQQRKELAAFARWVKKNPAREFNFEHVSQDVSILLNKFAATDAEAAGKLAYTYAQGA